MTRPIRAYFYDQKRSFTLMDNVHFHFNGSVTINISLPDSAGKVGDASY